MGNDEDDKGPSVRDMRIEGLEMRLLSLEGSRLEAMWDRVTTQKMFIRKAAIAIYAEPCMGRDAATSWRMARELWEAKPEDC
jgi:hypothetical protein